MKEKISLEEATMKALLGQLDTPEEEKDDVEGIIDGVLVVTDPEITPDEYEEVIDNAKEILEDTPEGEVPFNDQYVGEYLLTCPICGSSFINKDVLNVGDSCPICTEVPEQGFILNGQVATQEDVELQNDIKSEENREENDDVNIGLNDEESIEEEPVSDEDVEEVQDELLASETVRESDKKLEESKEDISDDYIKAELEKRYNEYCDENGDMDFQMWLDEFSDKEVEDIEDKYYTNLKESKKDTELFNNWLNYVNDHFSNAQSCNELLNSYLKANNITDKSLISKLKEYIKDNKNELNKKFGFKEESKSNKKDNYIKRPEQLKESTVKGMNDWKSDFTTDFEIGDLVTSEIVWNLRDSVPPITNTENLFQAGEPYSHNENGATYLTFTRVDKNTWRYDGPKNKIRKDTYIKKSEQLNEEKQLEVKSENILKEVRDKLYWLSTHNKNYTKEQYNTLLDIQELVEKLDDKELIEDSKKLVETGEWDDSDPDMQEWIKVMREDAEELAREINGECKSVKGFDAYQGPFAVVHSPKHGDVIMWGSEYEGFYNVKVAHQGWLEGSVAEIAEALNQNEIPKNVLFGESRKIQEDDSEWEDVDLD